MKECIRYLPGAKSTNNMGSVYWQDEMDANNEVDVLFVHSGMVLESSWGNVFVVKHGTVYTPGENILKGITRSIVIDLMEKYDIPYAIQAINTDELFDAGEVFITSTTKLVIPIVRKENMTIGNGLPGGNYKKNPGDVPSAFIR